MSPVLTLGRVLRGVGAAFACAISVHAQAAAGYAYQGQCFETKALALAAMCRGEFPVIFGDSDESASANTWSLLVKVLSCQSVTGSNTLNLWWNRPGQSGQSISLVVDNWATCELDKYFTSGDALGLGWGIGAVWIVVAAALRVRKGW